MGADYQLTRDFRLSEAPCWWLASPADIARLQETAARVAQPLRNTFGPVYITSWKWWREGCEPRDGVHELGGTIDLVVPGRTREAWEWGNTHLMPTGFIGRWIYEPESSSEHEHIHVAPRQDMLEYNGDGRIQSLEKLRSGDYAVELEWQAGTAANPYQLEPLVVSARAGIPWWIGLPLLFTIFTVDMAGQAQGGWVLGGRR
jgi:hypothetical protein